MPTREDVDLARAAIERGLLTVPESIECLKIQRDREAQGQEAPLSRILVETKLLTDEQLASLRQSLARAAALRHIGHYEILAKLGAGGMGTVYKARDTKADRVVALKVLSPGHASNREYIERFLREATASGRLSHPNIVQGYDAGEANGQYYFAMEFVDGSTVGDMLKEVKAIPEQQALDIGIQIAKALQHAEENYIVHRDVKPDNIMITEDGMAKLADLGLARLTTGDHTRTEHKSFGTVYYASPEQCEGDEEVDTKSDMYAFGATLFHMLAGRVVFEDESPEAIMSKHVQEKPPYLKDLNVQISHGASKITRKLLAKFKRDRYPQMADVVMDLTLVRMGRSPKLGKRSRYDSGEYRYRSSTGSWRTKRPRKWKRIGQISACVVVGLAILTGGYVAAQWLRSGPAPAIAKKEREQAQPEPPEAPKARSEERVLLDNALEQGRNLTTRKFLGKMRALAAQLKDEALRAEAKAKGKELLGKLTEEARPDFTKCRSDALDLQDEHRYQAALKRLQEFPTEYKDTTFATEKLPELRDQIIGKAKEEFNAIKRKADLLARQHKYEEARDAYEPVLSAFGLPRWEKEARAARTDLEKRKRAYDKKLADEREKERQRKLVAQDHAAITAALGKARDLVKRSRFAEAAGELEATAKKLASEAKGKVLRDAVKGLDALGALVKSLHKARKALRGHKKEVTLATKPAGDKPAVRYTGRISNVDSRRVVLVGTFNGLAGTRQVPWDKLSPESLKVLAEVRGALTDTERAGLYALSYFSGRAEAARAELGVLGEGAASRCRGYAALFEQAGRPAP